MAKYSTPASGNITTELDISSVLGEANATNVLTLLDNFQEKGPNGTHTCLVYEPMGGTVASTLEHLVESREPRNFKPRGTVRYPKTLAKRILKHTLLGLDAMHRCEIVHGDLQPGNLLFVARGLDKVDESKLQQDPANITAPLERLDGKKDQWAPEYLAIGQPLHEYADLGPSAEIRLSDFGAGEIAISNGPFLVPICKIDHSADITQLSSPKVLRPRL
jgi:serine/threonine protein kinase